MEEEFVEVIEIWQPVEKGGEAFRFHDGKSLKIIARLVNNRPIFLMNLLSATTVSTKCTE